MVNSRHPGFTGINGIAGNGSASPVEKEKSEIRLFTNNALRQRLRFFYFFLTIRHSLIEVY
jgi:hypothetical protein